MACGPRSAPRARTGRSKFGFSGDMRFGITVAHWDHPDWWAGTLQEAKDLAAEIDARPPIPEEEWIDEVPVVEAPPGDEYFPYETADDPPADPCRCGSAEPAVSIKPRRQTVAWCQDPSAFWRCPSCGAHRRDVDEWPYAVPREELFRSVSPQPGIHPIPSASGPHVRRWVWRFGGADEDRRLLRRDSSAACQPCHDTRSPFVHEPHLSPDHRGPRLAVAAGEPGTA